jgi:hypothetical protein
MDSIVFSFTDNMLLRENDIYGNRIDGWCLFLLGVHLILILSSGLLLVQVEKSSFQERN